MGFHLVQRVYENVVDTSPKEQAVLAYLALLADDKGVRKCYPSVEQIMCATHFGRTAVFGALDKLRELGLLNWTSGGRHKGEGGKALANEYTFNLPEARVREANHAGSARRTKHSSPDEPCIVREANPIISDHPSSHPSVIGSADTDTDVLDRLSSEVAANFSVNRPPAKFPQVTTQTPSQTPTRYEQQRTEKMLLMRDLVTRAMDVCGVSDEGNRKCFCSTLCCRSLYFAQNVIDAFVSEIKAGEHTNLRNRAAALNKRLAELPTTC